VLAKRHVMWAPWTDPPGLEDVLLRLRDDGAFLSGLILRGGGSGVRFRYVAELDVRWRLRSIRFNRLGVPGRDSGWGLSVDEDGTWRNDSGVEHSFLAGRVGLDMTGTPITKTLLLRKLDLAVGESAEVDVAHIMVPGLKLERRPQRYTRLGDRDYRVEGPDSTISYNDDRPVEDAVHEFEVDEDGLVLDWPGHFRRVWTFDREAAAREAEQIIVKRHEKEEKADPNGSIPG